MSIAGVSTSGVSAPRSERGEPRLWGADIRALHDRWWACAGVQVVRCDGAGSEPAPGGPRVFLLLGANDLVRLNIAPILKKMVWLKPRALRVRLVDRDGASYAERLRVAGDGRVEGVIRAYHPSTRATSRAAITNEIALARLWREASDPYLAWAAIDDEVGPDGSAPAKARALILDARSPAHQAAFVQQMVAKWQYPGVAFDGVYEYEPGVWLHESVEVPEGARFVAPVWVGAERGVRKGDTVVGPGIASDATDASTDPGEIDWPEVHSLGASRSRRQLDRKSVV